jgi:hypothetical protein
MLPLGGAIAMLAVGCGGSGVSPGAPGTGDGTATFVGRAVCAGCHAEIDAEYSTQAPGHGADFHTFHAPRDLTVGSCAPCHNTGYGEPSGWNPDGTTPHLANIGCEECHGPGSLHATEPSSSNIRRVPDSENSCWDCHVTSYKQVDGFIGPTTDADLRSKDPDSVTPHYRQTLMLLGLAGYNRSDEPGAHRFVDNTCTACHLNPRQSDVALAPSRQAGQLGPAKHDQASLAADLTTCAECHGSEGNALAIFEQFEEELNEDLIELIGADPGDPSQPDEDMGGGLLAAYATTHGIDITSNNNPDDPAVKAYKAARYDIGVVLSDRSHGAHNPEFAESLIEDARDLLGGAPAAASRTAARR